MCRYMTYIYETHISLHEEAICIQVASTRVKVSATTQLRSRRLMFPQHLATSQRELYEYACTPMHIHELRLIYGIVVGTVCR